MHRVAQPESGQAPDPNAVESFQFFCKAPIVQSTESLPQESAAGASHGHGEGGKATPRGDFYASIVWIIFGVAVFIGSWKMDRLEHQDINPYTIPGLVPGLLGLAVIFFGSLMLFRAWRQGALEAHGAAGAKQSTPQERTRFLVVLIPCLIFAVGLLGRGLPFWAASALYVFSTIAILQYPERRANGQLARGLIVAAMIALCAGALITLVFQEFFLVRLP
jgi:hypothetical protein